MTGRKYDHQIKARNVILTKQVLIPIMIMSLKELRKQQVGFCTNFCVMTNGSLKHGWNTLECIAGLVGKKMIESQASYFNLLQER